MFTRTELKLWTLPHLKILCNRYGLKPTSSGAYKDNYITALMAFPHLAVQQLVENKGLKKPSFDSCQNLGVALNEMSEPTTEQIALIRISMEGRRMEYPYRYEQERLLARYHAKNYLEQVISCPAKQLSLRTQR